MSWQVVEVTGVGNGELWFDVVEQGLRRPEAQAKAGRNERHIAIPEPSEQPDDWGEKWLNNELEVDDYEAA